MALRQGGQLPAKIRDAPQLQPGQEMYFLAYMELSSARTMGGLIPWTAVQEYGKALRLDEETCEDLHFLISEMDIARGNYYEAKEKRERRGKS